MEILFNVRLETKYKFNLSNFVSDKLLRCDNAIRKRNKTKFIYVWEIFLVEN